MIKEITIQQFVVHGTLRTKKPARWRVMEEVATKKPALRPAF
jgi:hypothetical protein